MFSDYNQSFNLGGLTAVIWTDFIQTIIMVISAFILMIISMLFL
jgi:Na+/proline symporter